MTAGFSPGGDICLLVALVSRPELGQDRGMRLRGELAVLGNWVVACACSTSSDGDWRNRDAATQWDAAVGLDAGAANVTGNHADTSVGPSAHAEAGQAHTELGAPDSGAVDAMVTAGERSMPRPSDADGGGAAWLDSGLAAVTFDVSVQLANERDPDAPTTVAIVTWSTSAGVPDAATIEFGLTTEYGMVAPVDIDAPDLRAVLLGMKAERTYHFRVLAQRGGVQWSSGDYEFTTGAEPSADEIAIEDYRVSSAEQRCPGFLIASHWNGNYQGMVFILDQDGDIVWWYRSGLNGGVAKAAMSADGLNLWMVSAANSGGEDLVRVGLDGLSRRVYPNTNGSHDIVSVEGDVMAFIAYEGNGAVYEIDGSGRLVRVFDASIFAAGGSRGHHLNALDYAPELGRYAVSSHDTDVYSFPRMGAELENTSRLTAAVGPNAGWGGYQHGLDLLPGDRMLVFANRVATTRGPSAALEFDLETGQEVWRYESEQSTSNFGGVQRLPNGNTLVTSSNAGSIYEVTPEPKAVLEVTTAPYLGYVTWTQSLYPSDERGE